MNRRIHYQAFGPNLAPEAACGDLRVWPAALTPNAAYVTCSRCKDWLRGCEPVKAPLEPELIPETYPGGMLFPGA